MKQSDKQMRKLVLVIELLIILIVVIVITIFQGYFMHDKIYVVMKACAENDMTALVYEVPKSQDYLAQYCYQGDKCEPFIRMMKMEGNLTVRIVNGFCVK